MLDDPSVEVVHVTTPNDLHSSRPRAALAGGRHVVCEKPLAMTAAETRELVALAAGGRLVTAVELQHPLLPAEPARS